MIEAEEAAARRADAHARRVASLEYQIEAEKAAAARAAHLETVREQLARLQGWRSRYSEACTEADTLMVQLAETMSRRRQIASEVAAVSPVRLRDVAKTQERIWAVRAMVHAGAWDFFSQTHPWGSATQALSDDVEWIGTAAGVDALEAELKAELADSPTTRAA